MAGKNSAISAPKVDKKVEIAKKGYKKITDEMIYEILGYMESGLSERKACMAADVHPGTFRQALARKNVSTQYAKALEIQAIAQIQQIEQTIEDMRNGTVDAQMARVEIDVRKWLASKLLPKTYGDKLDLTSDGKALPQPLLSGVTVQNLDEPPKAIE